MHDAGGRLDNKLVVVFVDAEEGVGSFLKFRRKKLINKKLDTKNTMMNLLITRKLLPKNAWTIDNDGEQ